MASMRTSYGGDGPVPGGGRNILRRFCGRTADEEGIGMTEKVATSWEQRFSSAARGMRFSAIRRMSALIEKPGIISFAPGQPSPETFPVEAFRQILDEVVEKESAGAFQYI